MRIPMVLAGVLVLTVAVAKPSYGQDEARLRKALEGKRITLKMDMPATQEGVDVYPGTNRPVDYDKVGKRMKKEGVAIKDGEAARITKIKVKDEVIEIQLNGGGFGTFGDALGSLKNQGADSGAAQQMRFQNERSEKLSAGSRFNLRYPNGVDPDDITASAVIQALDEYATFPAGVVPAIVSRSSNAPEVAPTPAPSAAIASDPVRKGMSSAEVTGALGAASSKSTSGPVTTNRYSTASGTVEVDFVNEVAVAVRQLGASSRQSLHKGLSTSEVQQ
jgi:hypothetical protein